MLIVNHYLTLMSIVYSFTKKLILVAVISVINRNIIHYFYFAI